MPYSLPDEFNQTGGLDQALQYVSGQVPTLFPMILVTVFLVIAISGYLSQERKTGRGNIAMWFSISGLITTTGAYMLFLMEGIINLTVLGICIAITSAASAWALVEKNY